MMNEPVHDPKDLKVTCRICSLERNSLRSLKLHSHDVHGLVCVFCDLSFTDLKKLNYHEMTHLPKTIKCPQKPCSYVCRKPCELKLHHEATHEGPKFSCTWPDCGVTFKRKQGLTDHMIRHSNEKPFKCSWIDCESAFKRKQVLTVHMTIHLDEKPLKCAWIDCESAFKRPQDLKTHMVVHSTVKPFECPLPNCFSTFKRRQHMEIHISNVHSTERPFDCPEENCDWTCKSKGDLKKHIYACHSNEKPFQCTYENCEKTFKRKAHLKEHMKSHTKEKPYKCTISDCTKTYAYDQMLKMHMNTHQGEKPFACDFEGCEFMARYKPTLKNHKNAVHLKKKWSCLLCDDKLSSSKSLKVHMRTHSGEKPFRCEVEGCDQSFPQTPALKSHHFYWHTKDGQVRMKKAEARIQNVLLKEQFLFKSQHTIDFKCMGDDRDGNLCFIDFLVEIKNEHGLTTMFVLLEVDENQHRYNEPSCELRRMAEVQRSLFADGNSIPILFIRYNPDAFKVDGQTKKTYKRDREAQLVNYLRNLEVDDEHKFAVAYFYYDMIGTTPSIFQHADYAESFKKYVIDCIS